MTVRVRDCTPQDFNMIQQWLNVVAARLAGANGMPPIPGPLPGKIHNIIHNPQLNFTVHCGQHDKRCSGLRGYQLGKKVVMCNMDGPALLAHELVHAADGRELDAEVVEVLLFSKQEGAIRANAGDVKIFREQSGGRYFYKCPNGHIHESSTQRFVMNLSDFLAPGTRW